MFRLILPATAALLACLPVQAAAWGKTGHRVTAAIGERLLSPQAQAAINDIIGAAESLAESSTWADEERSNMAEFWQNEAGAYHYVTVPAGQTYREAGAPPQGDAYTALERFTATLKDESASQDDKALALRFIVHIIGDLHQPLHVGDGTDRGGNDEAVIFFDEPDNLHRVWDEGLIDHEELSYTEWTDWLVAKITDDQLTEWSVADPLVWIEESAALRPSVYPDGANLEWRYVYEQRPVLRQRLSQAGVRMAAYLNEVFAE